MVHPPYRGSLYVKRYVDLNSDSDRYVVVATAGLLD